MEWLTLWLKKIILLVLLAAFLDLILPNTNLQRYVKMVMGLILLLTIISPVFNLFSLSQEDLALRLDRYQEQMNKPASAEWKRMTDKLLGQQDEQITAYVQAQVASAVKAQVKDEYGIDVAQVQVEVNSNNQEQPTLERIELVVGEPPKRVERAKEPIKPIQPIEIQIGSASKPASGAEVEAMAPEENPTYKKMAGEIARQWGLTEKQVVVKDESRQTEKQ